MDREKYFLIVIQKAMIHNKNKVSKDVCAKINYEERNEDIGTTLIITDNNYSENHQEINATLVLGEYNLNNKSITV